jgi:ParB family transcriptional regulator, chromosome partitioning protein
MPKSQPKLALSVSRDIPFDKLVLSQSNVRRIKAGVGIEDLAEDIARRTLLQSLTVRAVVGEAGQETGMFEVPSGGRRYRALELLVKQKRLAKNAPVPCIVRTEGDAEEDSLAENIQRAPLHPLDQFRAFLALREKGQSEEEIAAHQFVSVAVVKQRLRLASVSPKLLDVYAEDGLTLDQLMAFTVNGDHERQEQVFERLCQSYDKQPFTIRRMLTEGAVRAADKRAQFIGVDAYVEAGGCVMRDLFQGDDGGWLQDVGLVDMMMAEKLRDEANAVRAEGWKWVEVAPDFPYGHNYGLRQLRGDEVPVTPEEEATREALQAEYDEIEAAFSGPEDLPDEVDQRLGEIESALEALDNRPIAFDPNEVARAGAFVSIAPDGSLRVERGYVRPEDELPVEPEPVEDEQLESADGFRAVASSDEHDGAAPVMQASPEPAAEPEEDEGLTPISDRLMTELTAHRTLALRHALGERPEVAFLAALHALTLKAFYAYRLDTCLELEAKSVSFGTQAPGLNDSASARALDERHRAWSVSLPKEPEQLWSVLGEFDGDSRQALFAHCVALSVNAAYEPWNRRPRALAHADQLAEAVDLDMAGAGWTPTVDNFLGRVTKARILQAVSEAKGQRAADRIEHLKKGDMAAQAETLLAGSNWVPEPLRTPGRALALAAPAESEAYLVVPVEGGTEDSTVTIAEPATEDTTAEETEEVEQSAAPAYEPAVVDPAPFGEDEIAVDAPLVAAE